MGWDKNIEGIGVCIGLYWSDVDKCKWDKVTGALMHENNVLWDKDTWEFDVDLVKDTRLSLGVLDDTLGLEEEERVVAHDFWIVERTILKGMDWLRGIDECKEIEKGKLRFIKDDILAYVQYFCTR